MKNNKILMPIFFFGLFCVALGVCVALFGSAVNSSVIIITGLALVILSQFEIETLKIMGLEAKLKVTLSEAEVILGKMKGIALPISELAISVALINNRTDIHLTTSEMYKYILEIESKLEGIGASADDIKKVKDDWIKVSAYDLANSIVKKIVNKISIDLAEEERSVRDRIQKDASLDRAKEMAKSHYLSEQKIKCEQLIYDADLNFDNFNELLEVFIKETNVFEQSQKNEFWNENKDICDDIAYLLNNGKIRRPHLLAS